MTFRGGDEVGFLLIDGYSVLGLTTELRDDIEALTEESHGFGEAWVANAYTGMKRATLEQNGFFDDANDSTHEALSVGRGLSRIVNYSLEGNTIGQKAVGWQGALQVNYNRVATRGELHKASARYQVAGEVEEGKIIADLVARTTAGNTQDTPVDNTVQTTDGVNLYLQVSALTLGGYTNAIVKVWHKTLAGEWTLLDTFTAVTAAPAKERRLKTGNIERNLAVSWEWTGEGTGQSINFAVVAVRK